MRNASVSEFSKELALRLGSKYRVRGSGREVNVEDASGLVAVVDFDIREARITVVGHLEAGRRTYEMADNKCIDKVIDLVESYAATGSFPHLERSSGDGFEKLMKSVGKRQLLRDDGNDDDAMR